MQKLLLEDPDLLFFAGRAAILLIGFVVFAIALLRWRRSSREDVASLREETRALAEVTAGLADRIAALQQQLEERAQLARASVAPAGAGGIELAIRLAQQGCGTSDIAKTCGVTRQEAELLSRLHGADSQRAA